MACFSAKYFFGPNAGGFVAGRRRWWPMSRRWTSSGYESGPWRTFGRAFKLDRATVAATVAALEAWLAVDHEARWRGYAALAAALAARCGALPGARVALRHFTLDERLVDDGPVNAVVVRGARRRLRPRWPRGDPSVRAMADGDALVFCTETLTAAEVDEIGAAMSALWPN